MLTKGIDGYPNYAVCDDGRVMNMKTGRVLKPNRCLNGYYQVPLSHKGKRVNYLVHRLVALAFIEGDSALQVNHKDGDKGNNRKENLEWVTPSQNIIHAEALGLRNRGSKYSDEEITAVCWKLVSGYTCKTISEATGIKINTVYAIRARRYRADISESFEW